MTILLGDSIISNTGAIMGFNNCVRGQYIIHAITVEIGVILERLNFFSKLDCVTQLREKLNDTENNILCIILLM